MRYAPIFAVGFLALVFVASLFANATAPYTYEQQFREIPDAAPSHAHWLGTDSLGRDRYSRLLYGTRVSLLLAPTAAFLTTLLAAIVGGAAGFYGSYFETILMAAADLILSLPWFFLLITVRALLPLNVSPWTSVAITFLLLGCLGWAAAARFLCADVRALMQSNVLLAARASGIRSTRLLWRHTLPNLLPALSVQFWISIPVFILAEANLGLLGLGVTEPLPSWGSLLHELESDAVFSLRPEQILPLLLLIAVVSAFQFVVRKKESGL